MPLKKLLCWPNSSNFSLPRFFRNEYYHASKRGDKNLMDFHFFFLKTICRVSKVPTEDRGRISAGCRMSCLAVRCWIGRYFPLHSYVFFRVFTHSVEKAVTPRRCIMEQSQNRNMSSYTQMYLINNNTFLVP